MIRADKRAMGLGIAALCLIFAAPLPAEATIIYFSTRVRDNIDDLYFDSGDIIKYDTETGDASKFFDGDDYFKNPQADVDAFHLLPNGNLLLSTVGNEKIDGIQFQDEDIFELNPVTRATHLVFDGSAYFKNNEDLAVIERLDDGSFLFATATPGEIDATGLEFSSRDIVRFDPASDAFSIYFDGDAHFKGTQGSLDGLDVLSDGRLALSTRDHWAILGGVKFEREDIVLYDPQTKQLEFLFYGMDVLDGRDLVGDKGIDAIYIPEPTQPVVPEPGSLALLGTGMASLFGAGVRRRRKQRA